MNSLHTLAKGSRSLAGFLSIIDLLLGIPFLLFVGLQLISAGSGNLIINLNLLLLLTTLTGLVIAWWKEGLGALVAFVSLVGSFLLSGRVLPGVGIRQGSSLMVGPLNLLFALLTPGYSPDHSPSARLIPAISWALLLIPVFLFFASWLIRSKTPPIQPSPEETPQIDEQLRSNLLALLAEGLDNVAIADRLEMSPLETSLLTSTLVDEYGVKNRAALIEKLKEQPSG